MSLLFETIKIVDSKILNLPFHQARVDKAFNNLPGNKKPLDLEQVIKIPREFNSGLVKCKVIYDSSNYRVEFSPYTPRAVKSLKLVFSNNINYDYKYSEREDINSLFSLRGNADDILIVKNGMITDTSIANIVFTDGSSWFTPDAPLLKGTCRERLLQAGTIRERTITTSNLDEYSHLTLVNAMIEFNPENILPVSAIVD